MKRRSVLLLAEMANPEWPSVPLIGWQNAVYLREVANTHLITQIRNKKAIEKQGWIEGQDFTAVDSEAIAKIAYKLAMWFGAKNGKGWTTGMAFAAISYSHVYLPVPLTRPTSHRSTQWPWDLVCPIGWCPMGSWPRQGNGQIHVRVS